MSYLFVYGTLLSEIGAEASGFLQRYSSFVSEGSFPGKLFEVDGYPGAIFVPDEKSRVYGQILKLVQDEKVFEFLDNYEEVGSQFDAPNEYVRQQITVLNTNGQNLSFWVYLYNWPVDKLLCIPSGRYTDFRDERKI